MPIIIRTHDGSHAVQSTRFATENELESALADNPELLRQDHEPRVALAGRQLDLPDAGTLDLLFVNADGLPVAVEAKLGRNAQSRREVVAQAIDYLASLTSLTVDELDAIVGGRLEAALHGFEEDDPPADFDRLWQAVGANLRAGFARLVVALDEAPIGLERIVRFLARNSELDVQMVTVQRYSVPQVGQVVVPRFLITGASEEGRPSVRDKVPKPELVAATEFYNAISPPDLQAGGTAVNYRQIRPPDWPSGLRTHYEFYQTKNSLGAELHIESDAARSLAAVLSPLAGHPVADGSVHLLWDRNWSGGRGRLAAQCQPSAAANLVGSAMIDLIQLTRDKVADHFARMEPTLNGAT